MQEQKHIRGLSSVALIILRAPRTGFARSMR
jgi:hypothetical protein